MLGNRVERLQRRLEQEGRGGLSRFRRRRVIEELEAEVERATTDLADVTSRLASVQASMAGLPDRRELGELFGRLEKLDAKLRPEAAARVRAFRSAPPPYLTNALGPPPTDGWPRDRWERAAVAIEHHRLRWQVTDPSNALGDRGGGRRMQRDCADLRDEIRRTVEDLQRDRDPQQVLGRAR